MGLKITPANNEILPPQKQECPPSASVHSCQTVGHRHCFSIYTFIVEKYFLQRECSRLHEVVTKRNNHVPKECENRNNNKILP